MFVPQAEFEQLFQHLMQVAGKKTKRKQTVVRWFNRLYYDVDRWNKRFVKLLKQYPGLHGRADERLSLNEYRKKIEQFDDSLAGRWTADKSELCCNLRILTAKFKADFQWLRDDDPNAYDAILQIIDDAYGNENSIIDRARRMTSLLRGEWGTPEMIEQEIDRYISESREAVDSLNRYAEQVGVHLLTVDEYEAALDGIGSSDPNIMVLGELTMGPKITAGDNAIINVNSLLNDVTQTIRSGGDMDDSSKRELTNMVKQLQAELDKLKESHPVECELIASRMKEAAKTASASPPSRGLLEVTGKGLVDAATTLGKIAPTVLTVAKQVANFLLGLAP